MYFCICICVIIFLVLCICVFVFASSLSESASIDQGVRWFMWTKRQLVHLDDHQLGHREEVARWPNTYHMIIYDMWWLWSWYGDNDFDNCDYCVYINDHDQMIISWVPERKPLGWPDGRCTRWWFVMIMTIIGWSWVFLVIVEMILIRSSSSTGTKGSGLCQMVIIIWGPSLWLSYGHNMVIIWS